MTLSDGFAMSSGRVAGHEHTRLGRDGQDGVAVTQSPRRIVMVVTDGCSSTSASEVGARLGAVWVASACARAFAEEDADIESAARSVTVDVARRLRALARLCGDRARDVAGDMLLFTFLAAVFDESRAIVFGVGDGVVSINGKTSVISSPNEAPMYLAYSLFGEGRALEPEIHHAGPSREVESLLIATDGARALIEDQDSSLAALETDAALTRNPSLLQKRLAAYAGKRALFDDTTIALLQRRTIARELHAGGAS